MPLLVVRYGPGNAHAIEKRFGAEGYTVALVGRDPDRLRRGADRLVQDGVTAHPYVGDRLPGRLGPSRSMPVVSACRSRGPLITLVVLPDPRHLFCSRHRKQRASTHKTTSRTVPCTVHLTLTLRKAVYSSSRRRHRLPTT